jgi:hypothetical protein
MDPKGVVIEEQTVSRTWVSTAAREPPISSGAERVNGLSDQGGEMRGVEDA